MPVFTKYREISSFVLVHPSVNYFVCCRVINSEDECLFNFGGKLDAFSGGKYVKAMRTYNAVQGDT